MRKNARSFNHICIYVHRSSLFEKDEVINRIDGDIRVPFPGSSLNCLDRKAMPSSNLRMAMPVYLVCH